MIEEFAVTLEEMMSLGESTFSIDKGEYPLLSKYLADIEVRVHSSIYTLDVRDSYIIITPKFDLVSWELKKAVEDEIRHEIQQEIEDAGEEDLDNFIMGVLNETEGSDIEIGLESALKLLDLSSYSAEVIEMLEEEDLERILAEAVQMWPHSNRIPYLNFIQAYDESSRWVKMALELPGFVAGLPEVDLSRDVNSYIKAIAREFYREAVGTSGTGRERANDGRPLHHLTRFYRNVAEYEPQATSIPLEPGVQIVTKRDAPFDLDDLDQLPMSMSFTLSDGKPRLELAFPPLTKLTAGPAAVAVRIKETLERFYRETSATLAFFNELGALEHVEYSLDDECPVFLFALAGTRQATATVVDDVVFQAHVLYNLGETFQQRKMVKTIADVLADQ